VYGVLATGGCFDRSVESAEAVSERRWYIGLLCDPLQKIVVVGHGQRIEFDHP
jgi:hypothetical protein